MKTPATQSLVLSLTVALLAAACVTKRARAQASEPVRIAVAACPSQRVVDLSEVISITRSELSPRELDLTEGAGTGQSDGLLRLVVCHNATLAWQDSAGAPHQRELALAELARPTRARTLALALSELVSERSTAARERTPPTVPEPPAVKPVAQLHDDELTRRLPPPPPPPPAEPRGELAAELRMMSAPFTPLYGPRLTLRADRFRLGAAALFAQKPTQFGSVGIGEALASIGVEAYRPHPALALLAVLESGVTWVTPRAREFATAKSGLRYAGAALGGLRTSFGFGHSRWYASALLLAGYDVGLRARVYGKRVATTHGASVSVAIGIGWRN